LKKFVFAILIAFSAICALTNCSVPIGSLESPDSHDEIEGMWLIPHRQLYQIDDKFYRDKDFQLFIIEKGGRVVEIAPDLSKQQTFPDLGVKVAITGNVDLSNEFTEIMTKGFPGPHDLHQVGTHKITVTYKELKSSYYMIEVFSPNNGNTLGGDDGIGIIWLD